MVIVETYGASLRSLLIASGCLWKHLFISGCLGFQVHRTPFKGRCQHLLELRHHQTSIFIGYEMIRLFFHPNWIQSCFGHVYGMCSPLVRLKCVDRSQAVPDSSQQCAKPIMLALQRTTTNQLLLLPNLHHHPTLQRRCGTNKISRGNPKWWRSRSQNMRTRSPSGRF